MKYIRQFAIIMLFSLLGELCHLILPFPIPASIYGMVLLFLSLFPAKIQETVTDGLLGADT